MTSSKKLELKRKTVSVLSEREMTTMDGGVAEEAITTSFGNCTGFACCHDTSVVLLTIKLTVLIAG